VLDLGGRCGGASVLVALDAAGEAWIEYPLPVSAETGVRRHVLHIKERFYRALLTFAGSPAASARLVRVSAARLALMAARDTPAEALRAAWWHVTGKRVRARNRFQRLLAPLPCFDFRGWVERQRAQWRGEQGEIETRLAEGARPRFVVCVLVGAGGSVAADTEQSVRAQAYAAWTLTAVASAAELNAAMAGALEGWLENLVYGERMEHDSVLRL
jgi:hypothetical protein